MVETLRPDVFTQEEGAAPRIVGVGTGMGSFIIQSKKGPTDKALLITGWDQFVSRYGSYYRSFYGPISVKAFFDEGGNRCFIARVVGSGAAVGAKDARAQATGPTFGTVLSGNQETYNLEPGETLNVAIDGGGPQGHTFAAAEARMIGAGPPALPVPGGSWLDISFSGGDIRRVTFTGAEVTADQLAATINSFVTDGSCQVIAGVTIDLVSDQKGTGANVQIHGESVPGLAALLGLIVGTIIGTGDVADIDAVTAAEVAAKLAALVGGTATVENGYVRISTNTPGAAGSVQVDASSTATAIGFDNLVHAGSTGTIQNTIKVWAQNEGAWANNVQFDTEAYFTTLNSIFNSGGTSVQLVNVTKVREGDILKLYNPADGNTGYGVVYSVNTGTKIVTFMQPVTLSIPANPMPIGTYANSSTVHRVVTTTTQSLANGDTSVDLQSSTGLKEGSHVIIGDGTTMVDVIVTAVNGTEIQFAAVTLGATIASGAVAADVAFQIKVFENGTFQRVHEYLSMEPTDQVDYVGNRLYGDSNESTDIEVTDYGLTPTPLWMRQPDPQLEFLVGGVDGSAPSDNDWKGSASTPKSGLYLLDEWAPEINMISTPGITSVSVVGHGIDYCDRVGREDLEYIAMVPLADDEAQEAYDYRMRQLNKDSMFGVLYYPWGIMDDPEVDGQDISVPLEGWMQGIWASVAADRGVQKQPANYTLGTIKDLTHYVSDGEQDLLNPVGVNVIVARPGEGIRVMGGRTLWNTQDGRQWINVRRLLDFVKRSTKRGNRWAIQEVNDPTLWTKLRVSNQAFLRGMWQDGMLFPSDDESQAYFVKCDRENNPLEQRKAGRVWIYIGVNPPYPAEFVIIRISQWDGGAGATEEIA
jgi:hypothetical protein